MDPITILATVPAAFVGFSGVLGLLVGSFLNVVIYRLPAMLDRDWRAQCNALLHPDAPADTDTTRFNLVVPRSRCRECQHPIGALENIPILSYLVLRGRCRACRTRISPRYPVVEAAAAIFAAGAAVHFGFSPQAFAAMLLLWTLLALSVIDIDHQLLPDNMTLPLVWAGLLVNYFGVFVPLGTAVIGAMAGYLSLWLLFHGFKLLTGKEGMGYGDFKLFAAAGAWLGWQQLPLIILLASFVGAIVGIGFIVIKGRDRRLPIPFGPFICAGIVIALFWGDQLMRAYLQAARIPT